MQRLLGLSPVLLSALVVWLAGCTEETTTQVVGTSMYVNVYGALTFYPHEDTASTYILVALRSGRNEPMPGEQVTITMSDTNSRRIVPAYPHDNFLTDEDGELGLRYESTVGGGIDTLTFAAADMSVTKTIHYVVPFDDPYSIYVRVDPDTLYAANDATDSALVTVRLRDPRNIAVEYYQVFLSTNSGSLGWLPVTDSMGSASTWWHTNGEQGTFCIVAYAEQLTDTAWVTVLPPPIGQVRILAPDTVRIQHGDSAAVPVIVSVTSQEGHVLPGRTVSVSLENPGLGFLQLVNPQLGDTTNASGRLELTYHALNVGMQRIFAVCEGIAAMDSIVTLWAP